MDDSTNEVDGYLWDNTLQEEKDRLDAQAAIWDPYTKAYLERIRVTKGWTCLEIGAGSGTITTWLADRAAPDGRVVAADIDPRFLGWIDHSCVDVRKLDVTSDPIEEGAYDLVYARMVLMHLSEPERHLETMVRAVRPGGWICVQDVDLSFNESDASEHWTWPASNHDFSVRSMRALNGLLAMTGARTDFAKDTPRRLLGLGLNEVGAEAVTKLVWGEKGGTYEAAFERVKPYLVQYGGLAEEDAEERHRQMADPSYAFTSAPMVSAWGRKPS